MVDIETLGTERGFVILSISAIEFDIKTGEIISSYHATLDSVKSQEQGFRVCQDTLHWWSNQGAEAMEIAIKEPIDPFFGIMNFVYWVNNIREFKGEVLFWRNSPTVDLDMTDCYIRHFGLVTPWKHYEERDFRTIKGLVSLGVVEVELPEFEGIRHYGIDDCKHQIKCLVKILNKIENER